MSEDKYSRGSLVEAFFCGMFMCLVFMFACATQQGIKIAKHKIIKPKSGEWVRVTDPYTHICCRCQLVHHVYIDGDGSDGHYMVMHDYDKVRTEMFDRMEGRILTPGMMGRYPGDN